MWVTGAPCPGLVIGVQGHSLEAGVKTFPIPGTVSTDDNEFGVRPLHGFLCRRNLILV